MDLYQMIGEELNNIINGYEIEIIGRALAPILSSAPTPTFHDRNGNQLGVYRTTSLVFMFPYMTDLYKRNIET
jgi:hypothetical protein